jgi:glycosyltransferase involved in cell wall biosynthesis
MTGLGRIGRDLASLLTRRPEFRVGFYGMGGIGSRQLPFMQYAFPQTNEWGASHIREAWEDWAGDTPGIIMTIWDATRLDWFANPQKDSMPEDLYQWLANPPFAKWGYFPVDATGPNGKLTGIASATIARYERPLAYGPWGADLISRSIERPVDWLPHGINTDVFTPRDKKAARMAMGFKESDFVVGFNMTNQPRKYWGLAAEICDRMRKEDRNFKAWWHTDLLVRNHAWNIYALIGDFGLQDVVKVTLCGTMDDTALSYYYSGCDVTALPSGGEGFGYPIVESMACGTPCVHGDYGGGSYLVPEECIVACDESRFEGIHNCVRPVFFDEDWEDKIFVAKGRLDCRAMVEHLDWKKLWPSRWEKWFLEGVHAK